MSGQATIIPAGTVFKFEGLELHEAQYIIAILGEKPLNQVHALWSKLNGQLSAQANPQPAEAPHPEPSGPNDPMFDRPSARV